MPENADPTQNVTPQPVTPAPAGGQPVSSDGGVQEPMNPELANVSINRPAPVAKPATKPVTKFVATPKVPATGPVAPKKIGKEKLEKSKKNFILGCTGGLIFLFVLFMVLMVLMISRSGASNTVMQAFGLDPSGFRVFLQGVVGFTFGVLSLLFLVLLMVSLFRYLGAQKLDKEKRGRNLKLLILYSISLVFSVFIWVILASYIGNLQIATERVIAEIVVMEPKDTSNLVAPVEITFSALNVAKALQNGGVEISNMNWDLEGDGVFETPVVNPEVTHLYTKKGTYTVGLQVKVVGEENYREPYTRIISIPEAAFGAEPSTGTAPLDVQFDASVIVTKADIAGLDWDFEDDGKYELEGPDNLRPRHTFDQIGVYKVHLRAVDKANNVENYYRNIEVVASDKPIVSGVIDATPGLKGAVPFQVRFDAARSTGLKGSLVQYQWDFGDGSDLQTGKSASHIYTKPGFYSVILHVEDELGNKADNSVEVEAQGVSSPPEAKIGTAPVAEADKPLMGTLPFKVDFDASNSVDADNDMVSYEWDFNGDGTADQEGKKVTNTFDKAGTYTASLTVIDSEDQKSTVSLQIIVQEPGVLAVITATPAEGTAPLIVQFDGSSSSAYQGNIVSYEWDFGDGSLKTITGAIVSHKYAVVGSYEAKLKVLTNKNESASTSKLIYVREVPLKACFAPSRSNGLAPLTVAFDAKCSTGAVSTYSWQFGDGNNSTSKGPSHTFEFPGSYTVSLEVSDSKNNVSTYQEIIVVEGELK
jgi:PKD repeat protein